MNRNLFLAILLSFAFLANSIGFSHVALKAVHEASSMEQFTFDKLLSGEDPDSGKNAFYPFASFIAGILTVLCLTAIGSYRPNAGNRIRLQLTPVYFGANYVKPFSLNNQCIN